MKSFLSLQKLFLMLFLCLFILKANGHQKFDKTSSQWDKINKLKAKVEANPSNLKLNEAFIKAYNSDGPALGAVYKGWMEKFPKTFSVPFEIGKAYVNRENLKTTPFLLEASVLKPDNTEVWNLLAEDTKSFQNKADDPKGNPIVFSIDSSTEVGYKIKRLDFYYHDSLAFGHPVVIAVKNTKLILNAPTLLFQADAKQTPFLIFPGERILVKYAGSDSVQLSIQGNLQRTAELNFFRKLVQKTGNVYYAFMVMPYQRKVNTLAEINSLEKEIYVVKSKRLDFLDGYHKQFPMSTSFIKIAENSIKSTALTDSLLLYRNNLALLKSQNLYAKLIKEKLIAVEAISFVPFQINFNTYNTLVSLATTGTAIVNNVTDFVKRFEFADQNFSGTVRDFLLANTLYQAYSNNVDIPYKYLLKFDSICKNQGYKELLSERLAEKKADVYANASNKVLLNDGKTMQDMQFVLSKYKGKMVLLDFWASWCSPCRGEMPYFKILKKQYEGEDIAFLSISSDIKISDWLKANKEETLGNQNSFMLLNFDKSSFVKQYHINTIPRYLLIGKDGKMIDADAPRPSEPKLKALIDKYL